MRVEGAGVDTERVFHDTFVVGRAEACDLQVPVPKVSRRHTEVRHEDGSWWAVDLGSANGTYLDGRRIERERLNDGSQLRLSHDGPVLHVSLGAAARGDVTEASRPPVGSATWPGLGPGDEATDQHADAVAGGSEQPDAPYRESAEVEAPRADEPWGPGGAGARELEGSTAAYRQHYFSDATGEDAGEHTRMIRKAYQSVQDEQTQQHQQRLVLILAVASILVVLLGGYAAWQHLRAQTMETQMVAAFETARQLEASIMQIRHYIAEQGDATLEEQLAGLQRQQAEQLALAEGYVEEFGYRRRLTEEERVIHKVARIFNESEFEMPPDFIRTVREVIRDYWQTPSGRGRFMRAVQKAETLGYTPIIVATMQEYGLPPEFFYLALQESNFDSTAVGPATRWGIAKGMWQFIPTTGSAYDLEIGPRKDSRVVDPQDERHDPAAATDAAARYLLEIHSQLAGASSLLAMASYNWGERRIVGRLEELFEGIPDDVAERTYWNFYNEYSSRMPDETKDYVAKIFAAAVIGEDPRLFGFDMDNPLTPYMQ